MASAGAPVYTEMPPVLPSRVHGQSPRGQGAKPQVKSDEVSPFRTLILSPFVLLLQYDSLYHFYCYTPGFQIGTAHFV